METTEKLGLKKPGESDYYNVADQNENMDILEAALGERLEKLDGIAAGANRYVHPGSGTNPHGTTKADVGLGNADDTADAQKIVRGMRVHLGLSATGLVEASTNMNSVLEAIRTKLGYGHMIAWLHRNTDAVYLTDAPAAHGIVIAFYGANAPSWMGALFINGNNIYSYYAGGAGAWRLSDAATASSATTAAQVENGNFRTNKHQVWCENGHELYLNVAGTGPTVVGNTNSETMMNGSSVTIGSTNRHTPTLHHYMYIHALGYEQYAAPLEWFNEPDGKMRHILRVRALYTNGTITQDAKAILGSDSYRWNTVYSTTVLNTSDLKKKENIEEIEQAKDFILALKPVQFTYKEGDSCGKRKHMGFGAQDVAAAIKKLDMPDMSLVQASVIHRLTDPEEIEAHGGESVIEGYYDETAKEEDLSWSLNYTEFIAPMVAVMQEQERRIAALEKRIAAMEKGQ